ncbi:uncharacterized protein Z518_11222 [Rhinocladiella mackenziei CBS 650.93]|uniref:NmrA-like domain-containing protein n=1 Tax=Rhinocladiella mackenziei CBS 650.93 TaxID=1442369 RepID=A0A0D2I1B6_9EURO|nr:uncharacterized protein Z518_11222 [Rhinocladiella mackenziei CBS 650.93]KIW99483.1 hypothetical protein Z518_11222 [Rhinocladiella mackenziei CBS 650.93]
MASTLANTKPRIAVAGAGSLGLPVILALLDAGYPVTILSRSSSPRKEGIPADRNVAYATVDYTSVESLKQALRGHVALPVFGYKVATQTKLEEVAAKNPGFSYSVVINGPFLDWGLATGFLLDPKAHSATIFDGGDRKFSTTTLAGVAKAVVGIFSHLEQTKNRFVFVHEAVVTQNQLIELAKRRDPTGWKIQRASTEETKANCLATISKGNQNEIMGAMIGLIHAAVFGKRL